MTLRIFITMSFSLPDWPRIWPVILAIWYLAPLLLFRLDPVGPNRFGAPDAGASFKDYLAGYKVFSGRMERAAFWQAFQIASALVATCLLLSHLWPELAFLTSGIITIVLAPMPAAITRRLHDTNLSGWWQLAGPMPPTGTLWLLIRLCRKAG